MYLNRVTLIGFLGHNAETKVAGSINLAIFSLASKTSWKNDAGSWESRSEWHRCVAFGKLAAFAATLKKGAHVAIEGELRSHSYDREVAVGAAKSAVTQRVWEIRVDTLLKPTARRGWNLPSIHRPKSRKSRWRAEAPLRPLPSAGRRKQRLHRMVLSPSSTPSRSLGASSSKSCLVPR